jgi:hypothetical protein
MITSTLVNSSSITVPVRVFKSTNTGANGGTPITSAVTTIMICNTAAINLTDETVNSVNVNVYLVKAGGSYSTTNQVVNTLIVPAGETVFFSEERIVLDPNDEIWIGTSTANAVAVTVSSLLV